MPSVSECTERSRYCESSSEYVLVNDTSLTEAQKMPPVSSAIFLRLLMPSAPGTATVSIIMSLAFASLIM